MTLIWGSIILPSCPPASFCPTPACPVDVWDNGFCLKGDQRKKGEQPIPSSLPEAAAGFSGHRRKEGVSYTNQVRFSGETR